jgi:hypothetical protein
MNGAPACLAWTGGGTVAAWLPDPHPAVRARAAKAAVARIDVTHGVLPVQV